MSKRFIWGGRGGGKSEKLRRELGDAQRGTGRTYRAMKALPRNGVYIYYGFRGYYLDLAHALGRDDIDLVDAFRFLDWAKTEAMGKLFTGIYFDHAVQEFFEQHHPERWNAMLTELFRLKLYVRDHRDQM